jgi:hypothetical protein
VTDDERRLPHGFEYFPPNWKTLQKKNVNQFLNRLKLQRMPDDKFYDFNDFKEKFKTFLKANIQNNTNNIFYAVIEKLIHKFYVLKLNGNNNMNDFKIDDLRFLQVLGDVVKGKFNDVFQQMKSELPTSVVYTKKDLQKYMIPWWYNLKFATHNDGIEEPKKKKAKIAHSFNKSDINSIIQKGLASLQRANEIISNSKENTQKTRFESKSFDEILAQCEEKYCVKSALTSFGNNSKK